MGPVPVGLDLMQGHLHHRRSLPGQGPAAQPAAVAAIVDANHLVELLVTAEPDAVALMERHGGPEERSGEGHGVTLSLNDSFRSPGRWFDLLQKAAPVRKAGCRDRRIASPCLGLPGIGGGLCAETHMGPEADPGWGSRGSPALPPPACVSREEEPAAHRHPAQRVRRQAAIVSTSLSWRIAASAAWKEASSTRWVITTISAPSAVLSNCTID